MGFLCSVLFWLCVGTSTSISSQINSGSFPTAVAGTGITRNLSLLFGRSTSRVCYLCKVPDSLVAITPKGHHWDSQTSSCCRDAETAKGAHPGTPSAVREADTS